MKLLVAEDDPRMAHLLERGLRGEGHLVELAYNGETALALALEHSHDVLILDVMMPGMDGFSVVRALRRQDIGTPVLMLTARGEVGDRVRGLDSGADDYLAKPFDFDELAARVRALGRRQGEPQDNNGLAIGALELDLSRHEVRCGGETISLAPTEFRLLELFMRHPDQVLSRRSILSHVWAGEDEPQENLVDVYVHYLRKKLGTYVSIVTVRGIGYRLKSFT